MNKIKFSMNETNKIPLVTFALFAYNHEKFIHEAVTAALNQEYSKLEIILSDDHSSDSTFEIIESLVNNYGGPHEVVINRNSKNLGLSRHFSEIVARARGDIVVVAAGDDISLPERVKNTVEILCSDSEASFVSFTDVVIDEEGKVLKNPKISKPRNVQNVTLAEYISGLSFPFSGASRGFRKKIFDVFGGLNETCPTEDTPYILRGLMLGRAVISSECGILYRKHGLNISRPASLHIMNFDEIKKQYLQDAEVAYNSDLISEEFLLLINKWVERNYRRRIMASNLYKKQKTLTLLCELMIGNDFSVREKLGILKSKILGY